MHFSLPQKQKNLTKIVYPNANFFLFQIRNRCEIIGNDWLRTYDPAIGFRMVLGQLISYESWFFTNPQPFTLLENLPQDPNVNHVT